MPECRDLVRLALDSLVPALPVRLKAEEFQKALKWTKKVMLEEGHSAATQITHVWTLVSYLSYLHHN